MAKRGNSEGSIHKRSNGNWRAQISLGGKRLSHTAKTRTECNDWLRKTLDLVDGGMTYSKSEYTLGEFLLEWMDAKKNSLRPKPAQQYESIIRNDLLPIFGNAKLNKLNLSGFNRYYARLVAEGRGARTIRLIHSVLHSALEHATRIGLISRNPCHGAILPRNPTKEMKIFNEDQVTTFLIAAKSSSYKLIYQMAIATGMRQSEILGLKWEDVDWTRSTINVKRQAQYVNGKGIVFMEPKTRAGVRQIALGKTILDELQKHQAKQKEIRKQKGNDWQDNNLIFPTSIGTPISQRNLTRDFLKVIRRTEVPRLRFHDLRHTAASLMINRGIPIMVVSKILGHSKPGVTLNIYAHCVSESQLKAAKVMEEITTPITIDLKDITQKVEK
jgi:integrase